eukprot:CAMPEP_0185029044 /NCGR_PEP_ID=MMETSP1103-20130426/15118_1 /TAXON_ID=36769 /ORGANISM="Paraphysomonas bandaiensis, Strain Caron Lab Isolate" /LENGTH=301 /DNA_ID=CAMNT_0027563653 /DNA_START=46 /DNA_END=948 /DNA_ORIENTATION=+
MRCIASVKLYLMIYLLTLLSPYGRGDTNLPAVVIRLDDVLTFWCEEMSKAAIEATISMDVPISMGVIGVDLDKHQSFASYLRKVAENDLVEVLSHSYSHDVYAGSTLEWQENDLNDAQDIIEDVTRQSPVTFIPPTNVYDSNTLKALREHETIRVMSAQCSWSRTEPGETVVCGDGSDVVAPNITYDGLYMLPAGAVLGDTGYWNNYLLPANASIAADWIEAQIAAQGFSVLMLHPVEFATESTCTNLDTEKIAALQEVIRYGQGRWQFLSFTDAVEYISGEHLETKSTDDSSNGISKTSW